LEGQPIRPFWKLLKSSDRLEKSKSYKRPLAVFSET